MQQFTEVIALLLSDAWSTGLWLTLVVIASVAMVAFLVAACLIVFQARRRPWWQKVAIPSTGETITIWVFHDAKPGHLNQARGLIEALRRRVVALDDQWIECTRAAGSVTAQVRRIRQSQPRPNVIIAIGRDSHFPAIWVRWFWFRGTSESTCTGLWALMNPGWLRRAFDLCIIPAHDRVAEGDRVIVTDGAMNTIAPAQDAHEDQGLILLGGPSAHCHWDANRIAASVKSIVNKTPDVTWTASGSRRTPQETSRLMAQVAGSAAPRLAWHEGDDTEPGWVAAQLQRCATCWVTEDSVSMVYEALSAGARVGLIDLPSRGSGGRVARGVHSLIDRGMVVRFSDWQSGTPLPRNTTPLQEADRVADVIMGRLQASAH